MWLLPVLLLCLSGIVELATVAANDELLGRSPERGCTPQAFGFQGTGVLLGEDVMGLANVSEGLFGRQAGSECTIVNPAMRDSVG